MSLDDDPTTQHQWLATQRGDAATKRSANGCAPTGSRRLLSPNAAVRSLQLNPRLWQERHKDGRGLDCSYCREEPEHKLPEQVHAPAVFSSVLRVV